MRAQCSTKDKEKCRWKAAILILCLVGVCKEFRPSGPFLVDYAVDHKEFTAEEMTHEIIPATSISYIISLIWLLSVTDALCYKPIIILGSLATLATWSITIWLYSSIATAQLRQVFYGFATVSTELAYFTYMYANIEKADYSRVTSYTHSAIHFGQFLSGLLGQLLLSFHLLTIPHMNYLSFGGAIATFLVSLGIPRVLRSQTPSLPETALMERMKGEEVEEGTAAASLPVGLNYHRNTPAKKKPSFLTRWRAAPKLAWENLLYAYKDTEVRKWSAWWALSYGLYIQVDLYVESLWKEVEHGGSHQNVYNGAVHASHALISVLLGLLIGRAKLCWITWGCAIFGLGTMVQGGALLWMASTQHLYAAYGGFIIFQTFFQVLVIISQAKVAEQIREGSEAFIFGINTLLACIVHFVLTFGVTGRKGFRLPIREQYIVYGAYALILGCLFIFLGIGKVMGRRRRTVHISEAGGVRGEDEDAVAKTAADVELSTEMPYSIAKEH